jgi:hypothetical protein
MWISSEAQAFKKTLVKRTWNMQEKLPKHALLDNKYAEFIAANPEAAFVDPDDQSKRIAEQSRAAIAALSEIEKVNGDLVNTDSGEIITPSEDVTNAAPEAGKKPRGKKTTAEPASEPAAAAQEQQVEQPETKAANDINTEEAW